MSKLLELKQNDSCILSFESLKSKSTINAYSIHLSLFCKFHGIKTDQLLKLIKSEVRTLVLNYIVHLKRMAKQEAGKPKRGELSVNSVKYYIGGIKSFLDFNEVTLPWKKIGKFYEPIDEENQK